MGKIEEIKKVFEKLGLEELEIDIEENSSGKIGGFVVSKSFQGMSQIDRQNYIWDHLEKQLSEEKHKKIRAILTLTPAESDEAELEAA